MHILNAWTIITSYIISYLGEANVLFSDQCSPNIGTLTKIFKFLWHFCDNYIYDYCAATAVWIMTDRDIKLQAPFPYVIESYVPILLLSWIILEEASIELNPISGALDHPMLNQSPG